MNKLHRKAYKVLRQKGDALISSNFRNEIEYNTDGRIIRPSIGRIFVFLDLQAARNFAGASNVIWEVQAYSAYRLYVRLDIALTNSYANLKEFWDEDNEKGWRSRKVGFFTEYAPPGSYSCESLRMIREVR